jgi:hypothetical protein
LTFAVKELLLFGGFFIDFDLARLKRHPGAGIPQQNFHSSDAFCIPNCCKLRRKSADFHSSDAFCVPNCYFQKVNLLFWKNVDAFRGISRYCWGILGDFPPKKVPEFLYYKQDFF